MTLQIANWFKEQWLALLSSCLAIVTVALIGEQWIWAPVMGVFCQVIWIFYTIVKKQYGLLPAVIAFLFVYLRMWWTWWT